MKRLSAGKSPASRIINRYVVREVVSAWGAITVILFLTLLAVMLGRYLGFVAEGKLPSDLLFTVIALKTVGGLNLLLPFSLFLATMVTLGRMYRDSEVVILWACGVGPYGLLRPLILLALPTALVLVVLSLWVAPWTSRISTRMQDEATHRLEISGVQSGRFTELPRSERVFYVESLSKDGLVANNVFVHTPTEDGMRLVTARNAHQEVDPDTGSRYVLLEDGYHYEGKPGEAAFRILRFGSTRVLIDEPDESDIRFKAGSIPTSQLWGSADPEYIAELHWRFAPTISALVLMLVAMPLSRTSPREGRYAKVALGVLFFIVYSNLLGVGYVWLEQRSIPIAAGLWWVHAGALILAWLLTRSWRGPSGSGALKRRRR